MARRLLLVHGEMVMLGAYTTFVVQELIRGSAPWLFGWSLVIALPLAFLVGVLITSAIVRSKFGKLLVAVRDAESHARFLGYRVEHAKFFAFEASACMAGVAGALYVPQVGIINPGEFSPANSIEGSIDLTKHDEAEIAELGIGRKFQSRPSSKATASAKIWSWR